LDAERILRLHPRPGTRPGKGAIGASVALHGLVALIAWWLAVHAPAPPHADFRVYRVNIVSPPAQALGVPTLAPPVENAVRDASAEAKPAPDARAVKVAPAPRKATKAKAEPPKKAASTSRSKGKGQAPSKGSNPHPNAKVGGSGINVQLQGEEFPYPGYLENIILQISRFFRWSGSADLRAETYFVINRNGSVSDIQVTRSSGDWQFDLTVRGAIESAGERRAFGALPRGFEGDRLPISFYFQPPR
jgi:outer membrane biosynthesis protein TonB